MTGKERERHEVRINYEVWSTARWVCFIINSELMGGSARNVAKFQLAFFDALPSQ